ncbi:peptidase E [Ascidiimonas aurantiaca]|uniref:Type 1 glutamine amidotransferase-like domain-containing protein n=1 Tax=Ascidiimonas aurantiaca TaxID=1685432 RepID=UPI0030EBAE19
MKKLMSILILCSFSFSAYSQSDKMIFAFGGEVTEAFVKYTIKLTNKENPKICFLPTALADSPYYINYWYEITADLKMIPRVIRTWNVSNRQDKSFEELFLDMDAIIIGGGNVVNMLSIWKGQEIDKALRKAYDNGIVLAGGSAGSLCWFNRGITDSRPKELSIVEGLGFLDYSNNVHHDSGNGERKTLYHNYILSQKLNNGYASDERSGIVFKNGKAQASVSMNANSFSYHVYEKNGIIVEDKLDTEIIN